MVRMPSMSRIFFGSRGVFTSPVSCAPATTSAPSTMPGARCVRIDTACSSSVTVVGDDRDGPLALLVLPDAHDARALGEERRTLRGTGLEELDDAREAVGDVLTRDATGVEGTHGELRARLTDRLGGDDADRLAELDELAGGEHRAVAERCRRRPCTSRCPASSSAGVASSTPARPGGTRT